MELLSVWSLRRVLLAGEPSVMLRAMHNLLSAVGARPICLSAPFGEETLCRTLHQGRFSCVIVPDLLALHACTQQRPAALSMLLSETREAGVPLVMLLTGDKGNESAPLLSQAQGWACGASGDPMSVQCIRHPSGDPDGACLSALTLGARFLSGEHACTGMLTLDGRKR